MAPDRRSASGKITGGEVLVRALVAHGVQNIFTLSGNHLLSIYDAALDHGLRLIDTRHEGAAAHMADAWARVTGQPGVCLVTAGPGHTNALTGIATAYAVDSPVIWLSGQSEAERRDQGAMQEIDQVALARPVTKWARELADLRRLPDLVATAFRVAQTGRPGPVHLSLPGDLVDSTIDEADVALPPVIDWRQATRSPGPPPLVEQAVALLAGAERPAIIAGAGAWWSGAGPALQSFVEATHIPVFTIDSARGLISDDHPLCFGYPDPLLNAAGKLLARADVVLLFGKRPDFRLRFGQLFASEARIIAVEAEPADLARNRTPTVAITGSPAAVAEQLLGASQLHRWPRRPWLEELERARAEQHTWIDTVGQSEDAPLHPLRILREVWALLGEDYCLTFDAGDFIQWARAALPARQVGRWLRLGPMATLGCAIPFAVAAKLARPEARVFALTGDGGVGFYGFEFDTAVRHRLPFVTVVANDAAWGMEKMQQIGTFGADRIVAADLQPTRYDRIVEALGGHGEYVTDAGELHPALERALASGKPACVNVTARMVPSATTLAAIERKRERR
ncbi:MAG: thiamine pyrophosphate-binding protein [Chloroflexi bacterium]|nr:thiamine pyrophosphate-binding protein [Chloroflexota bacterium]